MSDNFSDRMDAQRAILKQINQRAWPREELFSLSDGAIRRWISTNRLEPDDEVVRLVREAGDVLLFLANSSQEQVSPEYISRSLNVAEILERIRAAMDSKRLSL